MSKPKQRIHYSSLIRRLWLIAVICACDAWICLLILWQMPFIYGVSVSAPAIGLLSLALLCCGCLSIVSIAVLLCKLPAASWQGIGDISSTRSLLVMSSNFVAMTLGIIFHSLFVF